MSLHSQKIALTDNRLRALKPAPAGKRVVIWDQLFPNFALRVTEHGRKTFYVVKRREGDVKPSWVALGSYPAMTLAKAREAAREALASLMSGRHPERVAEARRRAQREADESTFARVAERYMRHLATSDRPPRPSTVRSYTLYLRNALLPALGPMPVAEIGRRHVIDVLDSVREKSGVRAADLTKSVVSAILNFACDRALISANPAARLNTRNIIGQIQSRDRVLDNRELRAVWAALPELGRPFCDVYRVLALTGLRRSEIAECRWRELDLERGTLTIPSTRTKNHVEHLVTLPPLARQIFSEQHRFAGGDFVFSTTGGRRPVGDFAHAKARLDAFLAVDEIPHWTNHDIRRTVRSRLSELRVRSEVAEAVLGHVKRGIESVYDRHQYRDEKREALERWERHLLGIVEGGEGEKVVELAERRS